MTAGKLSKGDKLVAVDHSTIDYPPFRKNFYIEVTELTRLSPEELAELRAELDGACGGGGGLWRRAGGRAGGRVGGCVGGWAGGWVGGWAWVGGRARGGARQGWMLVSASQGTLQAWRSTHVRGFAGPQEGAHT